MRADSVPTETVLVQPETRSPLEEAAVCPHPIREDQIDEGRENIALDHCQAYPCRILHRRPDGREKVQETDDRHQRRVLEESDRYVDEWWNRDLQGLRQDDEAHGLPIVQSHRAGRFVLPLWHGLQAAADGLGNVGRC